MTSVLIIVILAIICGIGYSIYRNSVDSNYERKDKEEVIKPAENPMFKMLGLRIGGILNVKVGAGSFLLLNEKYMTSIDKSSYVITKLTSATINETLKIVRAYSENVIFQFNVMDKKLNDILVLVESEKNIITDNITQRQDFNNLGQELLYKNITFYSEGDFYFIERTVDEEIINTEEKLFMREVDEGQGNFEYALIKMEKYSICVYTGLVVADEEIEVI